ncbi:MAG TPA: tetratricopeptide repeat protein [Bryobacteraceae bacterium]|nr:tetratricopeptide repeat protein [Bryobacteraceae bacterium]
MRVLLSIVLAAGLPGMVQRDPAAQLASLVEEAQRAQARSDYRAAADAYRAAVSIHPELAQLWSNLGVMRYESHEYAGAEEALKQALQRDKSLFVPNLFLGLDLLELKRPREAAGYLLHAEKLSPDDPQVLLALGRAFHALFDPARSRDWYQRAANVAPQSGDAWFGLGISYLDMAERAGARMATSFNRTAYFGQLSAESFADQGRWREAIERDRLLLNSEQESPQCSRTFYGWALLQSGEVREAAEQFEKDLDSCPLAPPAKARLASGAGDHSASLLPVSHSEEPLPAIDKMSEQDLNSIASKEFFSGHFGATARIADRLMREWPNDVTGWYWAVRAYQRLGIASLARAGEVEPDSPRIHALLGEAYQRRKMSNEALQEYSRMLALQPDNIAGLAGLAAAYLQAGRLDEAQTAAQRALSKSPNDGEINLLMGEILVARRDYQRAEPYLEHGLHSRPDLVPRAHALLGRALARTGHPKEAINELKKGVSSDDDGSVYYQLARLYQSSGDTAAAATAFEKSQQIRLRRGVVASESDDASLDR